MLFANQFLVVQVTSSRYWARVSLFCSTSPSAQAHIYKIMFAWPPLALLLSAAFGVPRLPHLFTTLFKPGYMYEP